jgi:dTDP-glucose 4,6-dehydratase
MDNNSNYKNILICGGAGFIGSNFINLLINEYKIADINFINFDALTYSGNLENLRAVESAPNYKFVKGDICDAKTVESAIKKFNIDSIINFAAETHVDRSILDSSPFLNANVVGTVVLLDAAKKFNLKRYLQISTDEVYGSLGDSGSFSETSQIKPNSPYSAAKASADHFVRAYFKTYNLPTLITRCSNNYGTFQFPEKLIPLMILNSKENKKLPVYGDGMNVRDWVHVVDHCEAVWTVFNKGRVGEVYNIGGNCEITNIEIVKSIISQVGADESLIEYVSDRPGHDRRYAMNIEKIKSELGWTPRISFKDGFADTVRWYLDNKEWCDNVRSGDYMRYYKEQYGAEL